MNKSKIDVSEDFSAFKDTLDSLNEVVYRMSLPDGAYLYVNEAVERVFGYPKEYWLKKPILIADILHPDSKEYFTAEWNRLLNGVVPDSYEYKIFDPSGNARWIYQSNTGVYENGALVAIQGYCRDISKRKRSEDLNNQREKLLNEIGRIAKIGGWEHDLLTGQATWTRATYDIIGISYDATPPGAKEHLTYYEKEDAKRLEAAIQRAVKHREPFDLELRCRRADGAYFWARVIGQPVWHGDRCVKMVGTFQDITENKNAALALAENEAKFRLLFANTIDALLVADMETGVISECNPAAEILFKRSREELIGMHQSQLHPPEETTKDVSQSFEMHLKDPSAMLEAPIIDSEGIICLASIRVSHFTYDGKRQILGIFHDITDQRRAREELFLQKTRLESLQELNGMLDLPLEELMEKALEAALKLTNSSIGYFHFIHDDEFVQLNVWSKLAQESCTADSPWHYSIEKAGLWADCVRQGQPVVHNDCRAVFGRKGLPKGHVHLKRHMAVPFFQDGSVAAIIGVGNKEKEYTDFDVLQLQLFMDDFWGAVQRQQAVQAAEQASRAKAAFLANMAHELNTPLNGIVGCLNILALELGQGENKLLVDGALASSLRLTHLLADILELARSEHPAHELSLRTFQVHDLLRSQEQLFIPSLFEKGLEFRLAVDPVLSKELVGDSVRLQQVLGNLLGNAVKFTNHGHVALSAHQLRSTHQDQCRVLFIIQDTGEGIPDEVFDLIFEPFGLADDSFSRNHQGAGLGLSIVKKLVSLMDGGLAISSVEGEGTSVYLSVPFNYA